MTQDQMDALLSCADDRCADIKRTIKDMGVEDAIDMGMITVLTKEFNDLSGAMTQLAINGAKIQ
jgi:hypothetical protein